MKKFLTLSLLIFSFTLTACESTESANSSGDNLHSGVFTSTESLSHDWGKISIDGGNVEQVFRLTNSESTPLLLTGAVSSCMCTTADITISDGSSSGAFGMHGGPDWEHTVQPGESFDVRVVFDPMAHGPDAVGPIRRTVNIISKPDINSNKVAYTRIDVSADVLYEADFSTL